MANEIYRENKLAIEVIATGSTIDNDPSFKTPFRISTWTFRMNHVGVNRWIDSSEIYWNAFEFEDQQEYEAKRQKHAEARQQLEDEIRDLLKISGSDSSFSITKNVSEIFTAVMIEKVKDPEPEKRTVAELLHRSGSMLNALLCCAI